MTVTMQEGDSPYTQYIDETVNLTTENQSFSFPFDPTETDATNKLKFFVGLNTNCIYVDSVVFKEIEVDGIEQADEVQSISVYPNPVTSGRLSIKSETGEKISSIEIIDLNGRIVKAETADQEITEIDVSSFKKECTL